MGDFVSHASKFAEHTVIRDSMISWLTCNCEKIDLGIEIFRAGHRTIPMTTIEFDGDFDRKVYADWHLPLLSRLFGDRIELRHELY